LETESLINPEEIQELARRYGPTERRSYCLEMSKKSFTYFRKKLAKKRRGEVVLVVERSDELILHTKDFYPPGTFRLPSGGVKWGESVLSALHREAWEEMNLQIEVEHFLGLLEYAFRCQEETMPFVSYVFLVTGGEGDLIPQDEGERITSFHQVPVVGLAEVADGLRAVEEDWRDWGEFRAIAHDFVVETMGGV
jgi:ADP-ribose pyrophosphatase YjhB (NUDIX family)